MRERHRVVLCLDERAFLIDLVAAGEHAARTLTRARILLKADESDCGQAWSDEAIAEALDVGQATVQRMRRRYSERGIEAIYHRRPRRSYQRKLDGAAEAHLVAMACSEPPQERARWSLRLLADRMVELGHVDSLSHECVRQTLKKTRSSLG